MITEQTMPLDYATRMQEANDVTKTHVIISMGAALIPVPLLDLVVISSVQLKMLHRLATLYQIKFSKNLGKSLISALLGGLFPVSASTRMASMAKGMLGMGTATGMISMSILGGAATYAISRVFIQHFESGGTFLDFDPEKVREYFMNEFKQGQTVAAQLKEDNNQTESVTTPETTATPTEPQSTTVEADSAEEEKETTTQSSVVVEGEDNPIPVEEPEEDTTLNKKYCSHEKYFH